MVSLLEEHGQGGVADQHANEPYFSSFLIADPRSAWVLETSGRTWVAAPVEGTRAISNRLTIRGEWTRSSADVSVGADWDSWRSEEAPTGHADRRLAASRACLAGEPLTPAGLAGHLRDHGNGPWGAPGSDSSEVSPLPEKALPDGTGVTVCMHIRRYQNTTASMVTELPADPDVPVRACVAPGSPCASIYVPVFPPLAVPIALGEPATWQRFAALRDRVERDANALAGIRSVFAPVEEDLWAEADALVARRDAQAAFAEQAWCRVEEALGRVEAMAAARTW
jgi:hypothetical protein